MADVVLPQDIEILPLGLKGSLTVPDGASDALYANADER